MAAEQASDVRIRITYSGDETRIFLDRPWRLLKQILPTLGMIVIWAIAGMVASILLLANIADDRLFAIVWQTMWGLGGLFLFSLIVWRIFAREYVRVRASDLTVGHRLLFWTFGETYRAETIGSLRWISNNPNRKVTVNGRTIPQSAFEITVSGRPIRIAHRISRNEADKFSAVVRERLHVRSRRTPRMGSRHIEGMAS